MRKLATLLADRRGATAIEYGLIMALVFLAMAGALRFAAAQTVNMLSNVDSAVANAH